MESTNLQNLNSDEVEMGSIDLQILNSRKIKTHYSMLNSDVIGGNESNDENGIKLQLILFYSAQFYSSNTESSSNNIVGQKVVDMKYPIIYGSINLENSTHEKGESLYTFCEICEDVFSLPNTFMQGIYCNHYCYVEYIHNYIGKK